MRVARFPTSRRSKTVEHRTLATMVDDRAPDPEVEPRPSKASSTTTGPSPTTPATTCKIRDGLVDNARDADEQDQDDLLDLDQTELEELGLTLDDPHQPESE